MRRGYYPLIGLLLVVCTIALMGLSAADPEVRANDTRRARGDKKGTITSAEQLEENRRKLRQTARHPESLAELREQAEVFAKLDPAQRERILQLENSLAQQTSARRARLINVGERYLDWLETLDDKDREAIDNAQNPEARLALIRKLREQEWISRQPKAIRDKLAQLKQPDRNQLIARVRFEERQRRRGWKIASRFWSELNSNKRFTPPERLTDLPANVQEYILYFLVPRLSAEEKQQLAKAEGEWPGYVQTLVALADRYPPALASSVGPTKMEDLPRDVQRRLKVKGKDQKLIRKAEGKWPDFAQTVALIAYKNFISMPYDLWPAGFKVLSDPMKAFIETKLKPQLNSDEKLRLLHAEGKWPEYPGAIQELSDKYRLSPPWPNLPSSIRWQKYRLPGAVSMDHPQIPRHELRHFALFELSPEDRAKLNLAPGDPLLWQRLQEAYFEHNPAVQKRLQQDDSARRKTDTRPMLKPPAQKWKNKEL